MFAKNVFGSHLESIICKTINVRVRVRHARRPQARIPSRLSVFIYVINTVIGESGLCGWERQRKTAFDYLKSGHSVIYLDGISECSNSF